MMDHSKSEKLTAEFDSLYPAGHSNFRMKLQAGKAKLFAVRAHGSHVFDADGNEYIEYNGAMGPNLLGHTHPEFISALKDYIDTEALCYGTNILFSENDIKLARLLIKHIPCAEAVKLNVTGSEAVQTMFRIARAYTGKKRILRYEGAYHGWIDNVMPNVFQKGTDYSELPLPAVTPEKHFHYSDGLSPWAWEESLVIPFNDFAALETVMERYHDEIALVFVEPVLTDLFNIHPLPGYYEKMRELCDKYNVVMAFDEIVTGYRFGLGCGQEYVGVTPDACTLGKAVAGGVPFAAVVGRKRIMDVFREKVVMTGGTFNGAGFGVKAALTAVSLYEKDDCAMLKNIYRLTNILSDGMVDICKRHDVPMLLADAPGVFFTMFGVADGGRKKITDLKWIKEYDRKFYDAFRYHLMLEGVVVMPNCRWFVSGSHTDEDVEKTLAAFENAIQTTKNLQEFMK